jgi:transposase
MTDKQILTALLQLSAPWYIVRIDVEVAKEEAHIFVDHHPGHLPCATCGSPCLVEDHAADRTWRHLDMWQAKTFIHARMPRTRCAIHGVLRVAVPWSEPGSRFSMAFEERVIATILACQTVQGASCLLRISWDEARGIMERAVARGLGRREAEIIEYVGVDEKAIRKGHRYVTILTDLEGRRILEVTPERTVTSLVDALKSLDSRQISGVLAVSMDMWEPYRTAIDEAFTVPRPDVVHDRFHIVSHANKALNDVRKDEARELATAGRNDLTGTRLAILYGTENIPERYEATIAQLKASDLRTAKGYALKENLRRCWHHRLERTARKHFASWITWARRSTLRPFAKVADMIDKRFEDIVSYFRHPITNGPQEGMNAKLMSVIRAARGYRHHETFRMAALFFLGGLDMSLTWRHAPSNPL